MTLDLEGQSEVLFPSTELTQIQSSMERKWPTVDMYKHDFLITGAKRKECRKLNVFPGEEIAIPLISL